MDTLLAPNTMAPELLRQDDFDAFREDRRSRLSGLIERPMGKPVSWIAKVGATETVDGEHRSA